MALRNLHSKQRKTDEEALKQQELLYTQDLQLQQLEHKYNRLEGERSDHELAGLNNKIKVSGPVWCDVERCNYYNIYSMELYIVYQYVLL